ncbi:MAG: DNA polymerase III subunit gamma/tau [Gammaproteobacteria bacterium RBG_16_57_12]|nr:MAG: DNA polymerase III subunit gamma/tau [Gammaproteobacteria bacterium RBG_16_57_12]
MSYQVLARKWRPHSFKEMVGQEHVLRALINALDNERLHHAFLFTGTRGVGKTTIARILAKSLNCETGVSSTPCGTCSSCREIDDGRFVDLIEVDAASRTKVEDTRELLENVQYAPTRGRYKVYLIDEVHMLSAHSFNALLKTLEEPPPHVKFLLATTDPQRLPVTILSRCLQFNLKRLPLEQITRHLEHILTREGIAFEAPAVIQIARVADGSMRDALSLLDQAIAYGGGALKEREVHAMLGTIDQGHIYDLLEALAQGDSITLMSHTHRLAEQVPDYHGVLADLVSALHAIALAQITPAALDNTVAHQQRIEQLAKLISREDIQLYYQIALLGRRDLTLAPDPRVGFEMTMLRMLAFRPEMEKSRVTTAVVTSTARQNSAPAVAPVPATAPDKPKAGGQDWADTVARLKLSGLAQQLALNSAVKQLDDNLIHLVLGPEHAHLLSKERQAKLQQALRSHFGTQARLEITLETPAQETPALRQERQRDERQQAAIESFTTDQNIQSLISTFDAELNTGSIRPSE